MPRAEYPLSEKFSQMEDKVHVIENFLAWAKNQKGYLLCEPHKPQYFWYIPVNVNVPSLVLEFFGIDLVALEAEKRHMLEPADTAPAPATEGEGRQAAEGRAPPFLHK
jgi:hypothetical protein